MTVSYAFFQRLRNYVANGNHIIFTGGSLVSMEFINTYFWCGSSTPLHRQSTSSSSQPPPHLPTIDSAAHSRGRESRYNIEPTSGEAGYFGGTGYGNWSPGPWRKLVDKKLPWVFKMTPDTLYQVRLHPPPAPPGPCALSPQRWGGVPRRGQIDGQLACALEISELLVLCVLDHPTNGQIARGTLPQEGWGWPLVLFVLLVLCVVLCVVLYELQVL